MECERILIWHSYLVSSFGNCAINYTLRLALVEVRVYSFRIRGV
jgi:hypothetical protein